MRIIEIHEPILTTVFCPEVGFETARDGFCVTCGRTDHAKDKPEVGDTVFAKWAVGPAQRGSGWLQPNFVEGPLDAWVISGVWAFGYHVQVPGGGQIGIQREQFEITPR